MPDTDCVIARITQNLIDALDKRSITIGTEELETCAEGQRSVYDSQGADVYTEVCGPWPETLEINGIEKHISLHYVVECHINGISDIAPNDPITIQTKNAGADLSKMIIADLIRGGAALITRIEGEPYYYFTGSAAAPQFVIRIDVNVETFLNIQDPFQ